ncbi:MAG TPA: hypothetical protein VLW85_06130 [Myxococcales bacterium]|nr:hypothetical protein [Myxococcales bacterium]
MARALVVGVAAAALSCGLTSRDFDVAQPFQAGGGPPGFTQTFDSAQLLAPLSADVSAVSSITLTAARLESTDGGDISFISAASISVSGNALPDALLATLPSPPAAGVTSVQLQINPKELKPYLLQGGLVTASISYAPTPVTARTLKLTLTLHGSLL